MSTDATCLHVRYGYDIANDRNICADCGESWTPADVRPCPRCREAQRPDAPMRLVGRFGDPEDPTETIVLWQCETCAHVMLIR